MHTCPAFSMLMSSLGQLLETLRKERVKEGEKKGFQLKLCSTRRNWYDSISADVIIYSRNLILYLFHFHCVSLCACVSS